MARVPPLDGTTVGKKVAMAVTGYIFVGFVILHMLGNLKVFQGREKFNAYAEFLREMGAPFFGRGQLLWTVRAALIVCLVIHVWAAIQLARVSRAARPVAYRHPPHLEFSYASRTMRWGGFLLFAFVVYHLMHMTWGNAHAAFVPGDAYHNFVTGFRSWPVALAYAVAMFALGLHLYHGVWSGFRTLGAESPRYASARRPLAAILALLLVGGFLVPAFAVLVGTVR